MAWVLAVEKIEPKLAVITGGSQGIGRAMANEFAKAGYMTVILARTGPDVEKAAKEISGIGMCEGMALDVSSPSSVDDAFSRIAKKHGKIDVLVCCAGIYGPIGPLEENKPLEWKQAIDINLCGTVYCARAAVPYMKKHMFGRIITLAGGGVGGPNVKPNLSAYTTSKFAICGFVEALSSELEGSNITINAISPGAVNTRLLEQVLRAGEKAGKKFLEASKKQKETGGTPPELAAKMALFLASGSAGNISGKTISAVWEKPDVLSALDGKNKSIYTLRRIDGVLFKEKE
jgi:NAD(P)-dependent dehydrogenase (short-subunit alcohol dehydrogenase family)